MMHIGLCADENFALPLGVCLDSIFESNQGEELTVHVITQGLSDKTLSRIKKTEEKYGSPGSVKIYNITDDIFSQYPISDQFPESIYFRYLYAQLLPDSIERIIYIDCDTVVLSCLRELWKIPLDDDILLGAVEDRNGDDILIRNRIGRWDGTYFNSGVLLMNLKVWRRLDAFKVLADFIRNNHDICIYPDQDAINVVFASRMVRLPYKYNFTISFIEPFDRFRLHLSKKEELEQAFGKLAIVHFAAEKKPWHKDSKHPLLFLWHYFHRHSEWHDVKLTNKHSWIHRLMTKIVVLILYPGKKEWLNPNFREQLKVYEENYTA